MRTEHVNVEVVRQADAALSALTLLAELVPDHHREWAKLRGRVRMLVDGRRPAQA